MNTVQDYDEISGTLSFTAAFLLFWNDEIRTWNTQDYGGIASIDLPLSKTWSPTLIIRNGVETNSIYTFKNGMDIETATVLHTAYGSASFNAYGLYQVTCESDVTYYPFDEHKCVIYIISTNAMNQITLSNVTRILSDNTMPNSEWRIKEGSSKAVKGRLEWKISGNTYYQEQIEFTIVIVREAKFPCLNIVLPVVLISVVHLLVFQLPVDSGERTSFSFTLLLTLVVFMTMVAERLPPSNNISVFNIFLLHQLISSILTTSAVVFGIKLFYAESNNRAQGCIQRCVLYLYNVSVKRCKSKQEKITSEENGVKKETVISWRKVSNFFDDMCFLILCVNYGLPVCVYLILFLRR